ncbi:hypothetical protein BC332_04697 [Capsicum chinense]|nr:hypothetical protein BC332_04697 [Capsicum chinense]
MQSTCVFLFAFMLYLSHFKCDSRDIITSGNLLTNEGETLVSAGQIFELGFFNTTSDDGEFRYYDGIWYRDDGNLKVLDSMKNSYFSTELVSASSSNRTAKLFDSGNLVLIDDLLGKRLWQSFDHPTDTFLPGMRMDDTLKLTAWGVTQKDPTSGNYTFQLNQEGNSEYTIYQRTLLHWKGSAAPTASANPFNFRELPSFVVSMLSNYSKRSDISSMLSYFNHTRLVMNSTGEIQLYGWDNKSSGRSERWSEPQGFDPASPDDWLAGIYTGGCSRKSDISCNKKSEFDTFLNMHSMKFEEPDTEYYAAKSEEDCRKECLSNCKCLAYSYFQVGEARRGTKSSCWIWTSELVNLQADYTRGFNLSVRVAITDIGLSLVVTWLSDKVRKGWQEVQMTLQLG